MIRNAVSLFLLIIHITLLPFHWFNSHTLPVLTQQVCAAADKKLLVRDLGLQWSLCCLWKKREKVQRWVSTSLLRRGPCWSLSSHWSLCKCWRIFVPGICTVFVFCMIKISSFLPILGIPAGHMEHLRNWVSPAHNQSLFSALCWHIERLVNIIFQKQYTIDLN